jgi:hypothetical protein
MYEPLLGRRVFAEVEIFATSEFHGKKFVADIRNFATEPWEGGFEGSAGKGFRRKFLSFCFCNVVDLGVASLGLLIELNLIWVLM